jgi:predicted nucleic acid-binding Zn ribbon protein
MLPPRTHRPASCAVCGAALHVVNRGPARKTCGDRCRKRLSLANRPRRVPALDVVRRLAEAEDVASFAMLRSEARALLDLPS